MQTNLKNYDTPASWAPQQNQPYQPYEDRYISIPGGQQQLARPQNPALPQRPAGQKPKAPEKMPKARAMALANTFKRGIAIASIVGFGAFGGLVALHQVGTTSSSSGSSSTNSSSSSSSSSKNSNNFLNQQGGNTSGTSSSSTNSSSSSSSSTVTGTHTS